MKFTVPPLSVLKKREKKASILRSSDFCFKSILLQVISDSYACINFAVGSCALRPANLTIVIDKAFEKSSPTDPSLQSKSNVFHSRTAAS